MSAEDALFSLAPHLDRYNLREGGEDQIGLRSGWSSLDATMGGWLPGTLCVVAGRAGVGKTGFVVQSLLQVAEREERCALISMEMPEMQLMRRLVGMRAGHPSTTLRSKWSTMRDWDSVKRVMKQLSKLRICALFPEGPDERSLDGIVAQVRHLVSTGAKLIALDHLGLIRCPEGERRDVAIGMVVTALRGAVTGTGCTLLLICQTNRSSEKARADAKPMLSDLHNSGEIEQHADAVLIIQSSRTSADDLEVHLVKMRDCGGAGEYFCLRRNPVGVLE